MNSMRVCLWVMLLTAGSAVQAMNIDPYDEKEQFVWSENSGWIDMKANGRGAQISRDKITGYLWCSSIGWINLYPYSKDTNVGVRNDGNGNLSGLAWSENTGWINFDPKVPDSKVEYGVKVDADGYFTGWAWGENIGWINFNRAELKEHAARVCVVSIDDLANFARQWLRLGLTLSADLNRSYRVDLADFGIFARWWQDYCPDRWPLK